MCARSALFSANAVDNRTSPNWPNAEVTKGFSQQTFWSLSGLGREASKVLPSDDITILASSELNEQRDVKSMLLTVHMHNVSCGGIDDKPLELRVNTACRVSQEKGEDTAELPAFKTRSMFVLVNHILIEAKKQRNNDAPELDYTMSLFIILHAYTINTDR